MIQQQKKGNTFLFAFADTRFEWNCSQWRSLSPSNALNASGQHTARCIYLHSIENYLEPAVQDIVGPADFVIVQRNLVKSGVWDFCDYWRGLGKLVVADLDDAYQMMPWDNPAHRYWELNAPNIDPHPVPALEEGLRHVDGLTAPSKQLIQDWQHVVPGYWLPNWAEGAWYRDLPERKWNKEQIVIGWGGSVSHYNSWWGSGIREALSKVCEKVPQVVVKICGNDKRIYDQLPVPNNQKIYQPGVAPQQWPKIINTFDIGVAPLSGQYDQRRSWIKALEYLLVGIPWVGTGGIPYAEFANYGMLTENTPQAWYDALIDIIAHYPQRLEESKGNREVGFGYTMERNIDNYVATFRKAAAVRRDIRLPLIGYYNWENSNGGHEATRRVAR